jgi:tocopherol O-methyltransferase
MDVATFHWLVLFITDPFPASAMTCSDPFADAVRAHYDGLSAVYRALWGEHIHHGYWEDHESPAAAQVKLVAQLAKRARIRQGARVLDVGCGLGGSALWLARQLGCSVTGITLSPVQVRLAMGRVRAERLEEHVRFLVMDATQLDLDLESFDVVWIIECSEHIRDKAGLLASCARLLRPGGRLALCAWLASEHQPAEHAQLIAEVCHGMLCSLASLGDYTRWMQAGGLHAVEAEDITEHVAQTWVHCTAIVERPEIKALLQLMDRRTRDFVHAFAAIYRAYAVGAMSYGLFTATKPGERVAIAQEG